DCVCHGEVPSFPTRRSSDLPDIADSLGMDKGYGALVANVSKDGPADKAGVKVGDVIVEFDGKEVKDSGDLPIVVARIPVDKKVRSEEHTSELQSRVDLVCRL